MEFHLEVLLSIAAIVIAVFYLTLTVDYLRGRARHSEQFDAREEASSSSSSWNHKPSKGKKSAWLNFAKFGNAKGPFGGSGKCFDSRWAEKRELRARAHKVLWLIRRAAQSASFTWLHIVAEPMLRPDGIYDTFVEEMCEAVTRRMKLGQPRDCDPVDALMELLEDGPEDESDVKMSDVIVTAQIYAAFRKCYKNAPESDELVLERQIRKFGEEVLKILQGSQSKETNETSDETEDTETALVPNDHEGAVAKGHDISDFRKYIVSQVFSKLTDPNVSLGQKVGFVSSFVLIMITGFTMKHVVKHMKSTGTEICKVANK